MNNKYLIPVVLIIVSIISGCSQTRFTKQANHRKVPIYAPQAQSQQVDSPTRQSPVSSRFHARKRMVELAMHTIGTRYRYGGRNPRTGFDCSGLMHYVHKQGLGLNIPRTAAEQRDKSRSIKYSQLKPGDMLFFKTGKRTNHVGVYIGDRKFIHASTGSRRVKVAKMDTAYWHKRFVKFGTFL